MFPNLIKNTQDNFRSTPNHLIGLLGYTSAVTSFPCLSQLKNGAKNLFFSKDILHKMLKSKITHQAQNKVNGHIPLQKTSCETQCALSYQRKVKI